MLVHVRLECAPDASWLFGLQVGSAGGHERAGMCEGQLWSAGGLSSCGPSEAPGLPRPPSSP